jgi:hypothetical protein
MHQDGKDVDSLDLCVHVMDGIGNLSGMWPPQASRSMQQTSSSPTASSSSIALSVLIEVVKDPCTSENDALSAQSKPCRSPRQLFWDEHIVVRIPRADEVLLEPACLIRLNLVATNSTGETENIAMFQKPAREFLHMYFNSQGSLALPPDRGAARHECIAPLIAAAPSAPLFAPLPSSAGVTGGSVGDSRPLVSPLLQTVRLRLGVALLRVWPHGEASTAASVPSPTQSCE